MLNPVRLLLLCSPLLVLSPAVAGPDDALPPATQITLPKLVAVRDLRCDAIRRGKAERLKADIHRAETTSARPTDRIDAERRVSDREATAAAAFEEAGRLKARLERMTEAFIGARRKEWHGTVDEAERIRLEELILQAREFLDLGCDS